MDGQKPFTIITLYFSVHSTAMWCNSGVMSRDGKKKKDTERSGCREKRGREREKEQRRAWVIVCVCFQSMLNILALLADGLCKFKPHH